MSTILHLITGLETGGAEGMLARLAIRTDRTRYTSVVVSMTGAGAVGPRIAAAGIPLETLGLRRGAPDPRGLLRFIRILRRHRPAILQTWLYHADLLGLAANRLGHARRLLWNIRCTESTRSSVVRAILSRWSGTPAAIIVNSHAGQRFHERIGYRPKRWEFLPNGFDTTALRPDPTARRRLRAELGIADSTIVIGMAARHHPMKDHATFFAAAARLAAPDRQLVLLLAGAGMGRSNKSLMRTIAEQGPLPPVRLLGECSDMSTFYAALDVATMTSAFGEGFPNALGEAMSCGVPCVATDCGDAAEILGSTGEIVRPGDAVALAAAWERLATAGPEARRAFGAEARRRIVRHYDLAVIVRRYEALYEELLDLDRARPRDRSCAEIVAQPR